MILIFETIWLMSSEKFDKEKIIDGVVYELTGFMCKFDGSQIPQYTKKQAKITGLVRDKDEYLTYVNIPIQCPEIFISYNELCEMNYYLSDPILNEIKTWLDEEKNKDTYIYKILEKTITNLNCDAYRNMIPVLDRNAVTFEQLYAGKNYDIQYESVNYEDTFKLIESYFGGWNFGLGFEDKKLDVGGRYILTASCDFEDYIHEFPLYVMPIYFHMDFMPNWNSENEKSCFPKDKNFVTITIDKVCINVIDDIDKKWNDFLQVANN